MKTTSLLIAICLLISSCVGTTLIDSIPTDAHIFVDGYYMGKTPLVYSDGKVSGSQTYILIKKEGYKDLETLMFKDEQVDWAACGGAIFFVPLLWITGYESQHTYKLQADPNFIDDTEEPEQEQEEVQEEEIIQEESIEQEEDTQEESDSDEESEDDEDNEDDDTAPKKDQLKDEEDIDEE